MADDNSVYRDLFFEESDDNLQTLNDSILELEQEPDNIDLINSIFRVAHTLKGMSATMGYDVMTKLTHKMEDMFDLFKTGKMKVNTDHISLVFKCLDKLQELVDDLRDDKELEESQITDLWNELDRVESSVAQAKPNHLLRLRNMTKVRCRRNSNIMTMPIRTSSMMPKLTG